MLHANARYQATDMMIIKGDMQQNIRARAAARIATCAKERQRETAGDKRDNFQGMDATKKLWARAAARIARRDAHNANAKQQTTDMMIV